MFDMCALMSFVIIDVCFLVIFFSYDFLFVWQKDLRFPALGLLFLSTDLISKQSVSHKSL